MFADGAERPVPDCLVCGHKTMDLGHDLVYSVEGKHATILQARRCHTRSLVESCLSTMPQRNAHAHRLRDR